MGKRIVIVMGGILVVVISVFAVLSTTMLTPPRIERRIIVYAYGDEVTGIDPSLEDDTGIAIVGVIYETLTYYDHLSSEVKPRLATRWESSEDGKTWRFYLRRGVVFHDGYLFNATAVKISIERARDLYRKTGKGLGYIWDAVEEINIIDEYIVEFKLSYPQRLDVIASAAYSAYIFSPGVMEKSNVGNYLDRKLEEWFLAGNAAGTGPYRLISYDPTREIRLEKFKEWWGWREIGNPDAPDVVVVKIIPEPASQYSGLRAGEIDIACCIPRELVAGLEREGFNVIRLSAFRNFILIFNTRRYPTNITEFRLAIAHALDLTRVVREALLGYGQVASGVLPRGFPGHHDDFRYEFNVEKAREFISRSGVNVPLTIDILYQVDYEETRRFIDLFESMIGELGVRLERHATSWTILKDIAKGIWENPEKTPHIIIADWWPTLPSPYDYLYTMFHSESREWNFAGYENREYDELIDTAREIEGFNYTRALELYRRAQEIIYNEAVAIGLWDEIRPYVYSKRLVIPENAFNPIYTFVIRFELVRVRS